jgi:membrane dipeptidase
MIHRGGCAGWTRSDVERLYSECVVVDAAGPALKLDPSVWKRYASGGVTVLLATLATNEDMPATMENIAAFLRLLKHHSGSMSLAESVADIEEAKREGKLALVFHFQNARPLGRDAAMVELYRRLGVLVIQLTYNYRNNLGDGCLEPADAGLSQFGRRVVRRMNEQRVLVDLSHTGVRTTLEAMELSERPDVFTHANARAVYDHPRNLTDEQITAVADKGGVIGLCGFPGFITGDTDRPTIADLLRHVDYFAEKVGVDHVGLGVDHPMPERYQTAVELGDWNPSDYPKPPWCYPLDGGNSAALAAGMAERGYSADDIRKVLGGNFMRVFSSVWGR